MVAVEMVIKVVDDFLCPNSCFLTVAELSLVGVDSAVNEAGNAVVKLNLYFIIPRSIAAASRASR